MWYIKSMGWQVRQAYGDALDGDVSRRSSKGGGDKCFGLWLASEWAPSKLLGDPFVNLWYKPNVMLSNPPIRVHCKFATSLGEWVHFWAYHWLGGKGGYLIERDGTQPLLLSTVLLH